MPWTGASFRDKNRSLSAIQSAKAAKQANAVLKSTGDEGLAIAVANKNAKTHASRLYKHKGYAEGGEVKDNHPLSDAERKRFTASGIYHGPKITPDTARTIMQNDDDNERDAKDAERDVKDNERDAEKKPKGYAEGGVVRQTEKERDKALGDYRRFRGELRDAPPGIRDSFDEGTRDKFYVDEPKPRRREQKAEEIDVDAEAATKHGQRDFAHRVGEKLRRGDPSTDQNMDTAARAPGTQDSGEMAELPSRDEADYAGKELELARGGKITQVAGKPIGKDDGLIAAQKGEYVIRRSAVKKLGTKVLDEVNKGRLPSDRLYGRKAARS